MVFLSLEIYMLKKKFQILNLKCEGCESTKLTNLLAINGVKTITLNIPNSAIELTIKNKTTLGKVRLKLAQIGYPIVGAKNKLSKKVTS
jgi:copper chaperone CopZ